MIAWTITAFIIAGIVWQFIRARDRQADASARLAARRRVRARAAKQPAPASSDEPTDAQ
jgi:hypothetical protein